MILHGNAVPCNDSTIVSEFILFREEQDFILRKVRAVEEHICSHEAAVGSRLEVEADVSVAGFRTVPGSFIGTKPTPLGTWIDTRAGFAGEAVVTTHVVTLVDTFTITANLAVGAVGVFGAVGDVVVDVIVVAAVLVVVAIVDVNVELAANGAVAVVVDAVGFAVVVGAVAVVVGEALGERLALGLGGGLFTGATGEEKQCCSQESSGESRQCENLHGFLLGWLLWRALVLI